MQREYQLSTIEQRIYIVNYFVKNEGKMTKKDMAKKMAKKFGLKAGYLETVHKCRWFQDLLALMRMNQNRGRI